MNRYRSTPGLGPPKASTSTTCQKCLKRGHYSYECKASLQERPYATRPSRSMVLKDPRLARELESEKVKSSVEVEGIADEVLKEAEERRKEDEEGVRKGSSGEGRARSLGGRRRSRSRSESVETISTDRESQRERSRSPKRHRRPEHRRGSAGEKQDRSPSHSRARKRRYDSVSSRSESRSPPPHPSQRKNRRHRTVSPNDRGRPYGYRRGSRRSRSGSIDESMDKSRITKQRRLLSDEEDEEAENRDPGLTRRGGTGGGSYERRGERDLDPHPRRDEKWEEPDRRRNEGHVQRDAGWGKRGDVDGDRLDNGDAWLRRGKGGRERKERSLSPYSRRLALTQAMNMGR